MYLVISRDARLLHQRDDQSDDKKGKSLPNKLEKRIIIIIIIIIIVVRIIIIIIVITLIVVLIKIKIIIIMIIKITANYDF